MSVGDSKDFCFLPAKRSRETMLLSTVGISRCGEIFVTNNADKWTFVCSHCQKATNDIGVFVCHIRLEHLNGPQKLKEDIKTPKTPIITNSNFFQKENTQNIKNNLIKKRAHSEAILSRVSNNLDISSLTDSNEMVSIISPEKSMTSSDPSQEINEDIFTIASKNQDIKQRDFESEQVIEEIASNNEKHKNNTRKTHFETIAIDDDEEISDPGTNFDYTPNEEIDDEDANENRPNLKTNNNNRATASGSKRKIQYLGHTCEYCNINFKYRSILDYHIKKVHNIKPSQMPLKCKKCKKIFRSVSGLNYHLKAHDEKNHQQCPICLVKHKPNYFITHVLTHESDTCFPCQVCGKIHKSQEERMQHWKSHAEDMPFNCDFCYRRFRKQQYLTHHLKSHFQYQCQFCPTQFNAVEYQKPPYICTTCENLPDIKKRIQLQRFLANNCNVFNSDELTTNE